MSNLLKTMGQQSPGQRLIQKRNMNNCVYISPGLDSDPGLGNVPDKYDLLSIRIY